MAQAQPLKVAKIELLSDTHVRIQRVFDAPAHLVWEATTTPEHMREWYGCSAMQMVECEMDVRPGGKYHWTMRSGDGHECRFRGSYLEVDPPRRSVSTEEFLMGDTWTPPLHATATYDERGGITHLTLDLVYPSKAHRDGHLGSGMEHGMNEAHARLDAVLARMRR